MLVAGLKLLKTSFSSPTLKVIFLLKTLILEWAVDKNGHLRIKGTSLSLGREWHNAHTCSKLKFSSRLGKGIVSENRLLCCVPDMAYGSCPIWRISEKSTLAIEIDLNWSRRFISVELGRLPNTLSCKTLLICPICISMVLIEALWFLIAALVESRISLIMIEFSSCLLADSAINLVDRVHPTMYSRLIPKFFLLPFVDNLSFVELAWIADKTVRSFSTLGLEDVQCAIFSKYFCHLLNAILASVAVLEGGQYLSRNLVLRTSHVVIDPDGWFLSYLLAAPIRRLDSKTQYDVMIRRFDTSYPTGGYGVSGDQSEQNTI
ncbi:hypothetical protein Tco_1376664 [Tanacetum coccineum]